jgi:geranylgeranyl diphosphate synthase type I
MMKHDEFFSFLDSCDRRIKEFIISDSENAGLDPKDILESSLSYVERPAKRLRPAVLLMAAGSLGGREMEAAAFPAAVAVELFHTWTLVHDDLIDNDGLRRGKPTVHEAMAKRSHSVMGLSEAQSSEYGRDIAILTGDVQHGWAIAVLSDCGYNMSVDSKIVLKLIGHLESYVLRNLIYGEVLDVRYSMMSAFDMSSIDEDMIVEMLWLKTGVLYEFAGLAGALIGKGTDDFEDRQVNAIRAFASNCGTAFQLQDDILGVLGDEKSLGKPVGSDIREGKKTVIVYESLKNANDSERRSILSVLGNRSANSDQIGRITRLFEELGGIGRTQALARAYIERAVPHLDLIPDSKYKRMLLSWAEFMIARSF